jgi:hypothetical protein
MALRDLPCSLAIVFIVMFLGCSARAAPPAVIGCPDSYDPVPALQPLTSGPLTLTAVYCTQLRQGAFTQSPPSLSPDGNSFFSFNSMNGLSLGGIADGSPLLKFPGRATTVFSFLGDVPFAWSEDSRSVFGVKQDTAKPAGWALSPLRAFSFSLDGSVRQLPELRSENGPLDEIYWVEDAGLAVAAFGTKGDFYRPEHEDLRPTLALVDARTGQTLQSYKMQDLPDVPANRWIAGVSSGVNERGQIVSLIALGGKWLYWRQGQNPTFVSLSKIPHPRFVIDRRGTMVLLMTNLSATGMICEFNPKCPPPTPQSGAIAELRDIATGKLIWSIHGTAKTFSDTNFPTISPDGRFALISMPPRDGHWHTTALIDMASGKVLQEVLNPWNSQCATGFSPDGKLVWISGGSRIVTYRLTSPL